MARYSRRRGPLAAFEMSASFQVLPGFTITRSFGRGTLLICGHVRVFNFAGGAGSNHDLQVRLDAAAINNDNLVQNVTPAERNTLGFSYLQAIEPGVHTIELRIVSSAATGMFVDINASELVVIEFPEWDQDDDLITL